MIDKNGNVWTCIVCGKIAADAKTKVRYFFQHLFPENIFVEKSILLELQDISSWCRQTLSVTRKPILKGFPGRAIFVEKLVAPNLAWLNTRPSITRTKRGLWWQSRWFLNHLNKNLSIWFAATNGPKHPWRLHDQLSDWEARGCLGLYSLWKDCTRRPDQSKPEETHRGITWRQRRQKDV